MGGEKIGRKHSGQRRKSDRSLFPRLQESAWGLKVYFSHLFPMISKFFFSSSIGRLFIAVLLGGFSLFALPGCLVVAAGAGAGVVAYVRGDLEATLANDYNPVVDATRGAIKALEFAKVSDNKDAFKAVIVARTAVDKKVEILITNSGKNLTSIKIRVGVFGDEQLSLAILEKIKAAL
jgi:Protein of unknown function (DUF3568)